MSGGRKPRYSDEEILRAFTDTEAPVVTTSEIKEEFDYSTTSGARKRLEKLESQGLIKSKPVGPAQVWYLSDAGKDLLKPDDS